MAQWPPEYIESGRPQLAAIESPEHSTPNFGTIAKNKKIKMAKENNKQNHCVFCLFIKEKAWNI